MDNSFKMVRKGRLLDALERADEKDKISLLLDKVIKLEDTLHDLQEAYIELTIKYRTLCAPAPF